MRTGVPAMLASPIGIAAVSLAGIFVASFVGAIISVLATGGMAALFVAIGALALKEHPKLVAGFETLATKIKDVFARAAEPLLMPFIVALGMFTNSLLAAEPIIRRIFEGLAPAILPVTKGITGFLTILGEAMADVMPAFADVLARIGENLPTFATVLGNMFRQFADNKETIMKAVDWLFIFAEIIIITVVPVIITLTRMWVAFGSTFAAIGKAAGAIVDGFGNVVRGVFGWISSNWPKLLGIIVNPVQRGIGSAIKFVSGLPQAVGSAISRVASIFGRVIAYMTKPFREGVSRVLGFIRDLPGRIRSALGNLGGLLYSAGRAVIQGLINGITSMFGAVGSAVGNIVGFIADKLPGSPVKEGPLTKFNQMSTNPGAKLGEMFLEGFAHSLRQFMPAAPIPNVTVNPAVSNYNNPTVRVYLDGRELSPAIVRVMDERNMQLKRAVTSGGTRLP
jgi:phage-related protein